jgi:hypothetical protein
MGEYTKQTKIYVAFGFNKQKGDLLWVYRGYVQRFGNMDIVLQVKEKLV